MRDLGSGIVLRQGGDRCWLEYRAVAMDNAFSTVPIGSVGDIPRAVEQIAKIADVMDDFRVDRLGLVAAVADILTPWFAEREAQSNSESTCEACPSPAVIQLSYTRWRCGDCYEKFCDGRLTQYYEDLDRDRRDIALAPIARALGDPHGPIYGLDRVDCRWCGRPSMIESEYCSDDCRWSYDDPDGEGWIVAKGEVETCDRCKGSKLVDGPCDRCRLIAEDAGENSGDGISPAVSEGAEGLGVHAAAGGPGGGMMERPRDVKAVAVIFKSEGGPHVAYRPDDMLPADRVALELLNERMRQVVEGGWSANSLIGALDSYFGGQPKRQQLVIAGALIIAEIERWSCAPSTLRAGW